LIPFPYPYPIPISITEVKKKRLRKHKAGTKNNAIPFHSIQSTALFFFGDLLYLPDGLPIMPLTT